MTYLLNQLRWFSLPFVFIGAACLAIWLWLAFGAIAVAHCPPDLVWHGGLSGNKKCSWPLAVYLLKDMGGASAMGALTVLLCAVVAPARKAATASAAAIAVCALALLFLVGGDHGARPASLVFAVKVAFGVSSWFAVWGVSRCVQRRQA